MTKHLPPLNDPPSPKGDIWIAIVLVLFLVVALVDCSKAARVVVPGTVTVTIINPPEPVSCTRSGWSFEYAATNQVFRASRAVADPSALTLEITPALEECIYKDSFE